MQGKLTDHTNIVELIFLLCKLVELLSCYCRQWLEDALKENDPTSVQIFLVGTKKDLSVSLWLFKVDIACGYVMLFLLELDVDSSDGCQTHREFVFFWLKPQECLSFSYKPQKHI